jgi:hypothetical protein
VRHEVQHLEERDEDRDWVGWVGGWVG